MPFAASVSEHPVTATAIGETAGELLETLGAGADLVTLFVSPHHAGALEDAAAAARVILRPGALIGCAAAGVIGNGKEIEATAGVAVWGLRGRRVVTTHIVMEAGPGAEATVFGWPSRLPFPPALVVLIADPFSFPSAEFVAWLGRRHPGVPVVGGNASAGRGPGANRLVADGTVAAEGAVAAIIGPGPDITTLVSQGCRPVGQPFVVTRAERRMVYELGGQPAYTRLLDMARSDLSDADRRMLGQAVYLGVVIDEYREIYGPGDFLVRKVIGADKEAGAIALDGTVEVGTTVQYQVRGAATADEDLRRLLIECAETGDPRNTAALLVRGHDRGSLLFGEADHDAALVADLLDRPPTAGFISAGEFGPVGGRNFTHESAAAIAILHDT